MEVSIVMEVPQELDGLFPWESPENHGWNRKNQLEYLGMMISGGNVGICWNMLEYVGICWNVLEYVGIC